MLKLWQLELNKLILLSAIGGALGWSLDKPWAGAFLFSCLYSLWLLLYLKELAAWLENPYLEDIPTATGLLGKIFDGIYRQKKLQNTKIKRLKKTVEISRLSTNSISDAVILLNEHNALIWWNKAAKAFLGLRRSTDRNHLITNLLRDPAFITYFEQGKYRKGVDIPSPVNPDMILHITLSVFNKKNRILVARDVTHLHHLEQMRKDFVANVSHELRTPLTVIKGYVETFLDYLTPEEHIGLHRGLTQIEQQTHRMEILVNDLLVLSKLETDSSNSNHGIVNITSLLKQIHQEADAINGNKNHTIKLVVSSTINLQGDSNGLHSAFSNLITNAIKYTPDNGHIAIHWWKDNQGAHLSVKDDGLGIDPIHIPRLTERFYRVDPSRQAKSGGTGLGLAIVKHTLRHHEAQLEIQSTPGEGSNFLCHFPKRRLKKA